MPEPLDRSVRWKIRSGRLPTSEETYHDVVQAILSSGFASEVVGLLSSGKEADVFLVRYRGAPLAVKVYRLFQTSHRAGSTPKLDEMAFRAAREFQALHQAWEGGAPVPAPAGRVENLLFMRYLGDEEGPAPRLQDVALDDPRAFLEATTTSVEDLLRAGLVHGDLSAFNVLVHEERPWLIDFSDWIRVDRLGNPRWVRLTQGSQRLRRDLQSLDRYFRRYGLEVDVDALTSRWTRRMEENALRR